MFRDYYEFQMRAVKKHFTELADHAREYARRTQNKEILVSGNFFNCMPVYYPFEDKVDVIITEMEKTLFRQPHWYRYISGYSNTKPVIVAENPYGGIVPQLLEMLEAGQGYDLYRLFLLEASVYGCNMSVPYGGWMGNTIKNAFYPPASVTAQVQGFLAEHEEYYSKDSSAMIMVAYSFPSYYWREVTKSGGANALVEDESILFYKSLDMESEGASRLPFWEVIHLMSDRQVIYDVRMFGDEDLRPDRVDVSQWQQYELIVLPECDFLTANQREELEKYIDRGGRLLMFGKTAENCPGWARQMAEKKNVIICDNPASRGEAMKLFGQVFEELNDRIAQVKVKAEDVSLQNFVGVHCHRNQGVNTIHLLNYRYDSKEDLVQPIEHVSLEARIPSEATSVRCMDLDGKEIPCQARAAQGRLTVKLEKLPLYAVVEIRC